MRKGLRLHWAHPDIIKGIVGVVHPTITLSPRSLEFKDISLTCSYANNLMTSWVSGRIFKESPLSFLPEIQSVIIIIGLGMHKKQNNLHDFKASWVVLIDSKPLKPELVESNFY